jgi:hypothetical protein
MTIKIDEVKIPKFFSAHYQIHKDNDRAHHGRVH